MSELLVCTCGHAIASYSTCGCPGSCPTCFREDCCAEAWAIAERKRQDAKTPG